MENVIISIEKGLDDYKKALEKEGFEVHYSGDNDHEANVAIMCGIDEEYEEIDSNQCRVKGEGCMLVLDVSDISIEETIKLIETRKCNCN